MNTVIGGRGRPPRHPDAQDKLQDALVSQLCDSTSPISSREIFEYLSRERESYRLSEDEVADIKRNWANYAKRAKDNHVIESRGPRRGYTLHPDRQDEGGQEDDQQRDEVDVDVRQHRESLVHFPATLKLSKEFRARLISLPPKIRNLKWGTPDMLMVRWRNEELPILDDDFAEFHELLRAVDSSPKFVLSSVEIKIGPLNGRTQKFDAISQASVNGGWANESWLLIFTEDRESQYSLDQDSIRFAQDNGVGVLHLFMENVEGGGWSLGLETFLAPRQRDVLRLNSDSGRMMSGFYRAVRDVVKAFLDNGCYLDLDPGDADLSPEFYKVSEVLYSAYCNLEKQAGYQNETPQSVWERMRNNNQYMLEACYQYQPELVELSDLNFHEFQNELNNCQRISAGQKNVMQTFLNAFQE